MKKLLLCLLSGVDIGITISPANAAFFYPQSCWQDKAPVGGAAPPSPPRRNSSRHRRCRGSRRA